MSTLETRPFDDLTVDHIEFYVGDLAVAADWLTRGYGFEIYAATPGRADSVPPAEQAASEQAAVVGPVRSAAVGRNQIRLLLTQALAEDHPATAYVERHGDGVADIALGVHDAAAAFHEAVGRGARPVSRPIAHGDLVTATVMGVGDMAHTFVQRAKGTDPRALPGLRPPMSTATAATAPANGQSPSEPASTPELSEIDHFAVCVEAGQIDAAVEFYRRILDFELTFTERIAVGPQAITTKVVQSGSGKVTFTLIEPEVSPVASHIEEFLKNHGGVGVQHIAFSTDDIVRAVESINANGVAFLGTPDAYYGLLLERLEPARHAIGDLRRLAILVDEDHDGQLFQIFTRSVHPRGTLFLEVIERLGSHSFGSGNIKALYEAVEFQRDREQPGGA